MRKGLSLLQVMFTVTFILNQMGFYPFVRWPFWVIFGFLGADCLIRISCELWINYGLGDTLRTEIDRIKYEKIILRREIRKARLEFKKKQDSNKIENLKNGK